jgi:DNA-binding transcriptional MerR regulator
MAAQLNKLIADWRKAGVPLHVIHQRLAACSVDLEALERHEAKAAAAARRAAAEAAEADAARVLLAEKFKVGDEVKVSWPGSASGDNAKRAKIIRISDVGRIGVNVAQTNPKGAYTGRWGRSIRWFDPTEIVSSPDRKEAAAQAQAQDPPVCSAQEDVAVQDKLPVSQ